MNINTIVEKLSSSESMENIVAEKERPPSSETTTTQDNEMKMLNAFQRLRMANNEIEELEDRLSIALRALKDLEDSDSDPTTSLRLAKALHLVGSIHSKLHRFADSLVFLNRANIILSKLQNQGIAVDAKVLNDVQNELFKAHFVLFNYPEALQFFLNAMRIHELLWGPNSELLAMDRKVLAVIYGKLGDLEKALEQAVLAQGILKNFSRNSNLLLLTEIDVANWMNALGRCDQAIRDLKNIVHKADEDSEIQALAFMSLARASCNLKKYDDCKKYIRISLRILEKSKQISPTKIFDTYFEISEQYEEMKDFERAILMMKRSLALIEKLPREQDYLGKANERIGILLRLACKEQHAIPYLESAIENIKYSHGSNHFRVGVIYNNLGQAYLNLDKPEAAVEMFTMAKDIMDVALGPHDPVAIGTNQNLSKAYAEMKSFDPAIELQEQVIKVLESLGASAKDLLREAKQSFEMLKKQAHDFYANGSSNVKNFP